MKTKLLFSTLVIAFIAGSLSFAEFADAQDEKKSPSKAGDDNQTQNTFVFQVDETSKDTEAGYVQRSGDNVFVIRNQGKDVPNTANNQEIAWLVKPDSHTRRVQDSDEPHAKHEAHFGNRKVFVLRGHASDSSDRVFRILGNQLKGHWVSDDDSDHQLLLIHENGNIERIGSNHEPHAHSGDHQVRVHVEHAHQENGHDEHGHGEHGHGEHDGHHLSIHRSHGDMNFGGGEEVHKLLIETLAKHGISMEDDNVDVDVERSADGKLSIRIKAEKDAGSDHMKKRIEMNVERVHERGELHPPHDGHRVEDVKVIRDRDSGHRIARFTPGNNGPAGPHGAGANNQRHAHNGSGDLNERLGRLERQLESLENKIDQLLQSSGGNRGRSESRASGNRRDNDRQNDRRNRDSNDDRGSR